MTLPCHHQNMGSAHGYRPRSSLYFVRRTIRNRESAMNFKVMFACLTLSGAGCVSLPTQQEAAAADYGAYPTNYESIAKSFYASTLKDPDSVQYRGIAAPRQFWIGDRFTGAKYGYMVCVTLNAKNSYGGYVGFQTDGLMVRNGAVVQQIENGDWFGRQVC
jgi:hypothetical protein